MSDSADIAPFRASTRSIQPQWVDYNGHLNMAYYNVLFDNAIDEFFIAAGLGPEYLERTHASFFTVEAHICYVRELPPDASVYVESRILDIDSKRLHAYQELFHAEEGWLSATSEQMYLHVDMQARKTAPWPDEIRAHLDRMQADHATLPRPDRAGRTIGITRKTDK